jgi:hypothetical protein
MVDLSKDEAKQILIAMTKDMEFDGNSGLKKNGKPIGALVFRGKDDDFRSAYVKMASLVKGEGVSSFDVRVGGKQSYQIHDDEIVKRMCSYCSDLGKAR